MGIQRTVKHYVNRRDQIKGKLKKIYLTARLCGCFIMILWGKHSSLFHWVQQNTKWAGQKQKKMSCRESAAVRGGAWEHFHPLVPISWLVLPCDSFSPSGTTKLPPQRDPKPWGKHPKACWGHCCPCNFSVWAICVPSPASGKSQTGVRSCRKEPEINCSMIRQKNVIQSWECVIISLVYFHNCMENILEHFMQIIREHLIYAAKYCLKIPLAESSKW